MEVEPPVGGVGQRFAGGQRGGVSRTPSDGRKTEVALCLLFMLYAVRMARRGAVVL